MGTCRGEGCEVGGLWGPGAGQRPLNMPVSTAVLGKNLTLSGRRGTFVWGPESSAASPA